MRTDRCYIDETLSGEDQRTPFQRDRDRILYSSAFHRLAGITQIVRAGEFDIFHTRQQHTYKVAQVGRRLAEHRIESSRMRPRYMVLTRKLLKPLASRTI
jgi:dGTPase